MLVLPSPSRARFSSFLLVGVGHFLCLFVLVVVALDSYIAEGGIRLSLSVRFAKCIATA